MVTPRHRQPFPKWALIVVFSLVAATFVGAISARLLGFDPKQEHASPVVACVEARFVIAADGTIGVFRPGVSDPVYVIGMERAGFLRGILQTQVRPRKRADIPQDAPFRLNLTESGRLIMTDPGTPMTLEAAAFGHTNEGQLRDIFDAVRNARSPSESVSCGD